MKIYNLNQYIRGWIIGDFEKSIIRTTDFEVGLKEYKKGDRESAHVHKVSKEITVVVYGKFKMNDKIIQKGDIVCLEPNETGEFSCLEDGIITVVKTPSVIGDKYII